MYKKILGSEENEDKIENSPVDDDEDDVFSTLQNLSKADFRKFTDFSLKSAAEAAVPVTQNAASNQSTPFHL